MPLKLIPTVDRVRVRARGRARVTRWAGALPGSGLRGTRAGADGRARARPSAPARVPRSPEPGSAPAHRVTRARPRARTRTRSTVGISFRGML